VQADQIWLFIRVKVATDGIPNSLSDLIPGISFGKDGVTQGAGGVSTFGRFFYQKKHLLYHSSVSCLGRCQTHIQTAANILSLHYGVSHSRSGVRTMVSGKVVYDAEVLN
jgi:hypothetical protein